MNGVFVDQRIRALWQPDVMQVKLCAVVGCLQRGAGTGLRVAHVVEAFAVGSPLSAGELGPLNQVGQVFAGCDIAHFPVLPVGTGLGNGISQILAVVADGETGERGGAVGPQRVWIQQQTLGAIAGVHGQQDILVLQSVVMKNEVAAPGAEGTGVTFAIVKAGQVFPEPLPAGQRGEVLTGEFVLGGNPRFRFFRFGFFQPAVGVSYFCTLIGVDMVGFPCGWIGRALREKHSTQAY